MQFVVDSKGETTCIYSELLDLRQLGSLSIRRASHVEPDAEGRWFADMAPVGGSKLGPFATRSEALTAEEGWLEGLISGVRR